jgi:hypothetical protein
MDEEIINIQGNKALVSNNHADGEVNESSRDGETNTPVYIPHEAENVENDFGLLKNVDSMTADNTPQEPMSTKQDKNEDLTLVVKCSRCNRERKIYSLGQCKSCYNYLHLNKELHKLSVERWMQKNSTYQRDYFRKKYSKYKDEWIKEMVEEKDLNTLSTYQ